MSVPTGTGSPQGNGRPQEEPSAVLFGGGNPFAAEALHMREILGILRRRWGVVLLVMVVMGAAAATWLWARPRLYQATAAVLIVDARRSLAGPIINEPTGRGVGRLTDPIRSHVQVLQGRTVLGKAVDREGLRLSYRSSDFPRPLLSGISVADSARIDAIELTFAPHHLVARTALGETRAEYGERVEVGGVGFAVEEAPPVESATLRVLPREYAIDRLGDQLRVLPRTGTDVIEIGYTSTDPQRARRVVNAVAEVFQAHNLQLVQQQTMLRRVFLEGQLRTTEAGLIAAQQALNEFRRSRQVYRSSEQLGAQHQALMTLDIQRSELQADRRMYESLLEVLRTSATAERSALIRTLVSSPGIASNAVVSQLYAQLMVHEADRDELTTGPLGSTAANPDVERLNGLIAATENRLIDASQSHVASLDARLAALNDLRARNLAEMQELPEAETEETRLLQDIQTISNLAEAIRADLQRSRMAEAIETGQVEILELAPPARPVHAGRLKRLVLALMLGVLFGGAAAFGLEFMDGTIRRRREVEGLLRLPCLGVIPAMPASNGTHRRFRHGSRLHPDRSKPTGLPPTLFTPGADSRAGIEAFRRLRNNLHLPAATGSGNVLMITSPAPREGKTLTSANLAITVARQGRRTLVVDADLWRPALHELFQLPLQPGVSDVLLGQAPLADAIRETSVPNLFFLSAGEPFPPAYDPFGTDALRALLGRLAGEFDVVILDSPPVLAVADGMAFAAVSDAVLLVLRAGATRPDTAVQAVEDLSRAGARIVGAVLSDPDRKVLEDPSFHDYDGARTV